MKQQKCLSHIFRSIDEVLENSKGRTTSSASCSYRFSKKPSNSIKRHDPEKKGPDYWRRVQEFEKQVSHLSRNRRRSNEEKRRLLNELRRHQKRGNLLRFLHEPTVIEPTNNAAKRALRPAMIARKVAHCSRNEKGAEAFSPFKSVLETIKKQGEDVVEKLSELIRGGPLPVPKPQTIS